MTLHTRRFWVVTLVLVTLGVYGCRSVTAAEFNPPIGPYTNPAPAELAQAKSFTTNDPVVLTSYFYWYDIYSNLHLQNPDGSDALTDHPPTLTGFSFRSSSWHSTQLEDMMDAGIDVLMPVYWGEPSQRVAGQPISAQPWSYAGLPPLVQARQALLDSGKKPPAIGMFYDTSTLQFNERGRRVDLTTDDGRRWFYESIRDFFSLIPARHWAKIDGHPIIFLYSAAFASAHDQSVIDYTKKEFAKDFSGRTPYIVREISWNVRADNTYAWGGAISLRNPGVAALGPGYDHSAVPGRTPLIVPREGGAFFERNWIRFLRAPSRLVHVETWNEYHEGTDIAESREYGRQYIELNRKYSDMFRAGIKPPRPRGPYTEVKEVHTTLGATNQSRGVVQFDHADGVTAPTNTTGSQARTTVQTQFDGRYIYFQIDDSFKWTDRMLVDVEVEYLDEGSGSFRIEYDGPDPNAPFNGAYTSSKTSTTLSNTVTWKTGKFRLADGRFLNSQNGGADLRIVVQGSQLVIRKITVRRLGLPGEAGARLRGWQQDFAEPLGTNWAVVGAQGKFRQLGGVLRSDRAGAPTSLLALGGPAGNTRRELLARVRLISSEPTPNWLGGFLLTDGTNTESAALLFRRDPHGPKSLGLIFSGDSFGPFQPSVWHTNQWYWARVRHQPDALPGAPDILARLWPADGETVEPSAWTTWRDYYPASPALYGPSGIIAGQGVMEVDWLFLGSDDQPEIVARPPPPKPSLATLSASNSTSGLRVTLRGDPGVGYFLESSTNLQHWSGIALNADAQGSAVFTESTAAGSRFYRSRLAE